MYLRLRKRVAQALDPDRKHDSLSRWADVFLIVLILANVIAVILQSVPALDRVYHGLFYRFEVISVMIFSVEYLARVWSCVDSVDPRYQSPVKGRLRWIFSPLGLVDLLAILPFYVNLITVADLRFLRIIRLLRIFKLTRYSPALGVLYDVFREESRSLLMASFVMLIMLVIAAGGIYWVEHAAQPDAFGSIPAAMWWAIATLTTVGYGDVVPITAPGKVFGAIISLIGIGMVALPTGILTSGFADQMRRRRHQYSKALQQALDDGMITQSEALRLEDLRFNLGLSEDEASHLLTDSKHRKRRQPPSHCPHCGKSLQTEQQRN